MNSRKPQSISWAWKMCSVSGGGGGREGGTRGPRQPPRVGARVAGVGRGGKRRGRTPDAAVRAVQLVHHRQGELGRPHPALCGARAGRVMVGPVQVQGQVLRLVARGEHQQAPGQGGSGCVRGRREGPGISLSVSAGPPPPAGPRDRPAAHRRRVRPRRSGLPSSSSSYLPRRTSSRARARARARGACARRGGSAARGAAGSPPPRSRSPRRGTHQGKVATLKGVL